MIISKRDRVQALKHSKRYKEDLKRYLQERGDGEDVVVNDYVKLTPAGERLCKKWGLTAPVYLDQVIEPVLGTNGKELKSDKNAEKIVADQESRHANPIITYLDPPEEWGTPEGLTWTDSKQRLFTHVNKKLVLMIDLSYPKPQILTEFKKFLDRWGKPQKGRAKKNVVDIWEVYRLNEKVDNLLEVTRILFNIEKSPSNVPSYNDEVNRLYKQVQRAYLKACKIIKKIEQERQEVSA